MTHTTKEQAKVIYASGWMLEIPKYGMAPMLFLEWVSEFTSGKMPIQKIINNDLLQIRFHTITKKIIQQGADYINNNL